MPRYTGNPIVDEAIQRDIDAAAATKAASDPDDKSIGTGTPKSSTGGWYNDVAPVSRRIITTAGIVPLNVNPQFIYLDGHGSRYWNVYAPETQSRLLGQMQDAGLAGKNIDLSNGIDQQTMGTNWEQVLGWANEWNITPFKALARLQREGTYRSGGGGGGGGGGAKGPVIEIPDYPTIAQNAKNMLKQTLGRDLDDWEIAMTGKEMQKQYQQWAKTKESAALGGGGIYEVNDPQTMTQAFIDDEYTSELDRLGDMSDDRQDYGLAMQSFTQGAKMGAS